MSVRFRVVDVYWDTIMYAPYAPAGATMELFRDLSDKPESVCCFKLPRRLSAPGKLEAVKVECSHPEFLDRLQLSIKINARLFLDRKLSDFGENGLELAPSIIGANDEIAGRITFLGPGVLPAWPLSVKVFLKVGPEKVSSEVNS